MMELTILSILGAVVGGLITAGVNNNMAQQREEQARAENYRYNEMASEAQDERTRALYTDLQSPQAQIGNTMQALKQNGLSPALFYSGGASVSGGVSQSPIGSGTNGISPNVFGAPAMSATEIANTKLLNAEAEKAKAETNKINEETEHEKLNNEYQKLLNNDKNNENLLMLTTYVDDNGYNTSAFEIAQECKNYNEFVEKIRKAAKKGNFTNVEHFTTTERGQQVLRDIYATSERYDTYITQLSTDKTSAEFQLQVIKAMQNSEFAELNKDAAIQYLKTNISSAELTETQKEAWNNLLNKLGKKGETTHDILVVLGMIVNQMATNWHMPNFTTNNTNTTTNDIHRHTHYHAAE